MALGVYPQISLAEAREKHRVAHKQVAEKIDPAATKAEAAQVAKLGAANTFEKVARDWHHHNRGRWTARHADTIMYRLELYVFPKIGSIPVAEINNQITLALIRELERRDLTEVARRAFQLVCRVMGFAVIEGKAQAGITFSAKDALKPFKRGHFNAMTYKELPAFISTLKSNDARLMRPTRLAVELLMHTFVRTGELIKATWGEFDFEAKQWVIPAERMKMRKEHIVPLSKQVITMLEELKNITGGNGYLFPSITRRNGHMSNNTILKALERMGYRGIHTGHGFRALALSTIKEQLGYRHEVVDRQLSHVPSNQVDRAYDRAMFMSDRVIMMQRWSDYLVKICN